MEIVSSEGVLLDAHIDVVDSTSAPGAFDVVLAARGDGRNKDYTEALRLILLRMAEAGGVLLDAVLDTGETRKKRLSRDRRRLSLPDGASYPLMLHGADVGSLLSSLKGSQPRIGQSPTATGGNTTRRIVLTVRFGTEPFPVENVAALLKYPAPESGSHVVPSARPSSQDLDEDILDGHRVFAVYVGQKSQPNLVIGLQQGIWGFRDELMKATRAATYESMTPGDVLVIGFASRAPGGPRRPSEDWQGHPFRHVAIGVITNLEHGSTADVWPDDVYPWRVTFEAQWSADDVVLGTALSEAMRLSGVGAGAPILVGAEAVPGPPGRARSSVFPPGAPTDRIGKAVRRGEQEWLRRTLLDGRTIAPCAICSLDFPDWMLTAAHTKKRSDCSDSERRDPNVGMLACPNCDQTFEKGAILVNERGVIEVPSLSGQPAGLAEHLSKVAGKICTAFSESSKAYFAHRYEANVRR